MGNSESGEEDQQSQEQEYNNDKIEDQYDPINQISHSSYGQIQILEHRTTHSPPVAMRSMLFQEKEQFNQFIQEILHLKTLSHPYLIQLRDFKTQQNNNFCSSSYSVQVILDYYPQTLQQILETKKQTKQKFSLDQILEILYQTLQALNYLTNNAINHTNIVPKQIFITDQNAIKLGIPQLMTGIPYYQACMIGHENYQYLAPELFSNLHYQTPELQSIDMQKSDIFSLGMVALQMALLEDNQNIYDMEGLKLRPDVLNKKLKKVENLYGQNLMNIIKKFIQEEQGRYNVKQGLKLLNEQNQIQIQSFIKNEKINQIEWQNTKYSTNQDDEPQPQKIQNKKQKNDQNSVTQSIDISHNQYFKVNPSMKNLDKMINMAISNSNETKKKFENSYQIRKKFKNHQNIDSSVYMEPDNQNLSRFSMRGSTQNRSISQQKQQQRWK